MLKHCIIYAAINSGTIYEAPAFERCLFRHTKLVKIDFQTSTFADCRFEGALKDVLFHRQAFKGERFPPNDMVNVDFTAAKLHDVGFRNLVLDRVRFPDDAEHVVIKNFAAAMDQAIAALSREDDAARNERHDAGQQDTHE